MEKILVIIIVLAAVGLIFVTLKERNKPCDGGCTGCPLLGQCEKPHKKAKNKSLDSHKSKQPKRNPSIRKSNSK